jgi:hypothetical protein
MAKKPKTTKKRARKLDTRDKMMQVFIWLAEMRSYGEIKKLIMQEWGISVSRKNIWQIHRAKKNAHTIAFLKKRFLENIAQIPIANKSVRLKYAQAIYEDAMTEKVLGYSKDGEPIYNTEKGYALGAIKEARDEVTKKVPAVLINDNRKAVFQNINVKGVSTENLVEDINHRLSTQVQEEHRVQGESSGESRK